MQTQPIKVRALHPCYGLPMSARRAFELIAVGLVPKATPTTLRPLVRRKLIEATELMTTVTIRPGLSFELPVYQLPTHIHLKWCEWATIREKYQTKKKKS